MNKYLFIFLSSITMILCMNFPIELESGYIFDLRYIPYIIVSLYGGYKITLPIYLILNLERFIIGGTGIIESFIFSTVLFMILPLFRKWFKKQSSQKRVVVASVLSFSIMVVYLSVLSFKVPHNMEFWALSFNAITHYVIVMIIVMILIERIIRNIHTRDMLFYSEKLNVISELSASVAHEIRNPLTVTNGFLQLLKESKSISPDEKIYVEYSLQELNRAETIVNDFLAFAKPQSENMIYSNFKNETEYVRNIILPYAKMHQVDVQLIFKNKLNTKYDKNQMHQCLLNLYKNGIEAMKESGGTLSISVTEEKNRILIKIRDTGIGMTSEEISQLSKPYYSTKKEGTGLGMLMVYSAINKMNGTITVESEKGKGTTFCLGIPALNSIFDE